MSSPTRDPANRDPRTLHGVVPPVCTPLTPELEVDARSLERLVNFLLSGGVHGVFALGSSGETAFLTDGQRERVLDVVVSTVAGQVPVLGGAIDMTTPRVLERARSVQRAGADAVVATAPFYARTHPAEIEHHFRLLASGADLPLYAYDLPVSVGSKLDPELLLRLAEEGLLAGVKDSSGDDAALRTLLLGRRRRALDGFSVLTGSEVTVDNALRMGADGVVPGLGNVDPHGYVELHRNCRDGLWDVARADQERLHELKGMTEVADPTRVGASSAGLGAFKAALRHRGVIDCARTAPPQLPLEDHEVDRVKQHLVAAELL